MKILLYNPVSGHGHYDSWTAMFAEILSKNGHHVMVMTPDVAKIQTILAQHIRSDLRNIRLLPWKQDNLWESLTQKNPEWTIAQNAAAILEPSPWLSPLEAAARINVALSSNGGADFLFFTYMDVYPKDETTWVEFGRFVHIPWGGAVFHPTYNLQKIGTEGYYNLAACRGMCFLEVASKENYEFVQPKKVFQTLPDITDTSLPAKTPDIIIRIKKKAAGRRVVLLAGSVDSRKNIAGFCELAAQADQNRYFFALVGRQFDYTFSDNDKKKLAMFAADARSNTFLWREHIPDERDLNALFMASDVIFAVYRNFRGSSNMLAKAAAFEKPLLVSDKYLMGELTRRYRLGLTVPEDDPGMLHTLAALCSLESLPPTEMGFEAHRHDFSSQTMGSAISSFIRRCMEKIS